MVSKSSSPLVSAVITTHNRADLLPRALNSVTGQTYETVEIVIVDDGSRDNTADVVQEYRNRRNLKYIRLKDSVGAPRARNIGIKEASGEFIAGLDDDDAWHKDRIRLMIEAYNDDLAGVTSDVKMVMPNGEVVWKKKKNINLETLLYTNQVGNQILTRRDRLLNVGGFDPELTAAQDYDLWIRLCERYGDFRNVQQPLQTVYLDHQEGRITDKSFDGYFEFYKKHKSRFNKSQRKYQLYNIRRAEGKPVQLWEFISMIPVFRYFDEIKKLVLDKFWR